MTTNTLRVVSALLCYPQPELIAALPELATLVREDRELPVVERGRLVDFIDELRESDLWELQERYVALFDRGRKLSLHLFEHIHGESRERGQAMVDLLEVYRRGGYELAAKELPDYLPLFLEFLSTRPADEARSLLDDASHVIALLGARLAERHSPYAAAFDALLALVDAPADLGEIRAQAATEGPDRTITEMDKIWEEEQVTFLANQAPDGGCGAGSGAQTNAQPVAFAPPRNVRAPAPRPVL